MNPRTILRLALVLSPLLLATCGEDRRTVLINMTADDAVELYDIYVYEGDSKAEKLHTGWTAPSNAEKAISTQAYFIGLEFKDLADPTKPTTKKNFSVVIFGATRQTPDSPPLKEGEPPPSGAKHFFYAEHISFSKNNLEAVGRLLHVPVEDDMDSDWYPNAASWLASVPEAGGYYGGTSQAGKPRSDLLDCADTEVRDLEGNPVKNLLPASVHPFAKEVCNDNVDQDCDGKDRTCEDKDGDGDPDDTDCAPEDPAIHHPTDRDPYPQSANCCGYSLGKTGADATKDLTGDPLCHPGTCGNGIKEDCSENDEPCKVDTDCDTFAATAEQPMTCASKPADSTGVDCNDCDPAINPSAPEVCDGIDNNCNKLTDETCVNCDLDGDGYQRSDGKNKCPTAEYMAMGKKVDCNDDDAGVFPTSTQTAVPILQGASSTCNGQEGGSVACALRGACRNKGPDGKQQDVDCDGTAAKGCPPAKCDEDGDGFVGDDKAALAECKAFKAGDCNDKDPTIFKNAPDKCGDKAVIYNCSQKTNCSSDNDRDGWDSSVDCDDTNPNVFPWAKETCDGKDNDCDGLTDEGNPDANGNPMVKDGKVQSCTDSNIGMCGTKDNPTAAGRCVCSASSVAGLFFDQSNRVACPGENDEIDKGAKKALAAPRCYAAYQPQPQSCNPTDAKDDDCDGRKDAPDGKNFPMVGQPCWTSPKGQCATGTGKMGKITGCKQDSGGSNCIAKFYIGTLKQPSPNNPWFMCDDKVVCPIGELCNGFDDDCDGELPTGEKDQDADGYMQCGSTYPKYALGGKCEATLSKTVIGCGDCADVKGMTTTVDNAKINPNAKDVCNGIDDDCNPDNADGVSDCPGPFPAPICCGSMGCKDPSTDVSNCMACGNACKLTNAVPMCVKGACAVKSCNSPFNDCDKAPANGCESNSTTDPGNCAGCGMVCSSNNIKTPVCSASVCSGACNQGFADCDKNKLSNGCEINLQNDAKNCGGCGNSCATERIGHACVNGGCGCNTASDCPDGLPCDAGNVCKFGADQPCGSDSQCASGKCCGGLCKETQVDVSHCGGCSQACSSSNISSRHCGAGKCDGACATNFYDCDTNKLTNGCEINGATDVNNCDGCGKKCSANNWANVATYNCASAACGIAACATNFDDCDKTASNGCEVNLATSAANCGKCSQACPGASAHVPSPSCASSKCNGMCESGWSDCNNDKLSDGCEIHSDEDPMNCGGCAKACSSSHIAMQICSMGVCSGTCSGDWADCDMNKLSNGCEVDTASTAAHCGGCNMACSTSHVPMPTCASKKCNGTCETGYGDCDNDKLTNGCETNIRTTALHCGGCNMACSTDHITAACTSGNCTGTCAAGWDDCNMNKRSDGCEQNVSTDVMNCGGCSMACSASHITAACSSGNCTGVCEAGYVDCDMDKRSNGCECNTTTHTCSGGVCKANNGESCTGDTDCVSNHCVATLAGPKVCNATTCTAPCQGAKADGSACENAMDGTSCTGGICAGGVCKKDDGATCTADTECAHAHCVAKQSASPVVKICNATACATCEVAKNDGSGCVGATPGTDPAATCLTTQTCNSSKECKLKTGQVCMAGTDCYTTNCQPESASQSRCAATGVDCSADCQYVKTDGSACNTASSGTDPKSKCGYFFCGGASACPTTCTADTACKTTGWCKKAPNGCVKQLDAGAACSTNDCESPTPGCRQCGGATPACPGATSSNCSNP